MTQPEQGALFLDHLGLPVCQQPGHMAAQEQRTPGSSSWASQVDRRRHVEGALGWRGCELATGPYEHSC